MKEKEIINSLVNAGADIIKILNNFGVHASYDQMGKNIRCPFHDDSNPSMQLNCNNTVHCYGCEIHFDIVQLYTALKTNDVELAKEIWDDDKTNEIIENMIEDFNLDLCFAFDSGYIIDEKQLYINQLKEEWVYRINDSLFIRNISMSDEPYSPIQLEAKAIYIYKDAKTKDHLVIKVRYEACLGTTHEQILYSRKGLDYVEHVRATPDSPIKKKSFRFYDIKDGRIVKGILPDDKKDIVYNGERIFNIIGDENRRNSTWIWFVEGEKDVNSLGEYGFTACSLMKGSGSNWNKSYNDLFKGCKVIICGDLDSAGLKYEETLFNALYYGEYIEEDKTKRCTIGLKTMNRKFYEVNKMPEKSDITDLIELWKQDGLSKSDIISKLYEIIERSIDYKAIDSVVENNKGLYFGKKKIADFTIVDAINIISTDNSQSDMVQLTIRGTGMACKGPHTRVACIHEIFGSPDAFNKTFSVIDCTFIGNKEELFKLKKFILTYKIFHNRTMYSTNGMFKHEGEWIIVTPDGALRNDGTWDNDVFSSNTIMYNDLVDIEIPNKDKVNVVAHALLNFNTSEIVYNILGEVGCKLLNARYKELGIKNHLLAINGTKGAGKTETSVKILAALTNNSTRGEYNLSGQSNFTFLKNISSNNIGGMILQELKLGRMSDYDKNKWSEAFRNNYDRAKSQRGTKDQELNQYEQNNPIITTGEEGIGSESALYERFNLIFMTADRRLSNYEYSENFRILCDNQAVLRGIGKQMLIDIMNLTDEDIKIARKHIESEIRNKGLDKKGFIDRILNNVINVIHGFIILSNTIVELGYTDHINTEEAFDMIINNFLENVLRIDEGKANDDYQQMLLSYQQALENDYYDKVVGEASNAYCVKESSLWISPSKLRGVVANYVKDSRQEISVLSETEFRKNLVKAGYISEDSSQKKKFNQKDVKGHYYKVNLAAIKKLQIEFIDELIRSNEVYVSIDNIYPKQQEEVVKFKEEPTMIKQKENMPPF